MELIDKNDALIILMAHSRWLNRSEEFMRGYIYAMEKIEEMKPVELTIVKMEDLENREF